METTNEDDRYQLTNLGEIILEEGTSLAEDIMFDLNVVETSENSTIVVRYSKEGITEVRTNDGEILNIVLINDDALSTGEQDPGMVLAIHNALVRRFPMVMVAADRAR